MTRRKPNSSAGCEPNCPSESWIDLLSADPRAKLAGSDDPSARYIALTALLDRDADEAAVIAARREIVGSPAIGALVARLPAWSPPFSFGGHQSPAFPPNLLRLLHGLGVRRGDFSRIEAFLDQVASRQADDGRFLTPGRSDAAWRSLPCDHFALLESLLLFGDASSPAVSRGLARLAETFEATAQGPGWRCFPDPIAKWRGPGRKGDACLQVTVEALRVFALAPEGARPTGLDAAAETLLGAWQRRNSEKPYMFGHGKRFVAGKWPPTWYDAAAVLEALATRPAVWSATAPAENRQAVAAIATALAGNFDIEGLVTPSSCYKEFADYSFGQKKTPSHFATARLCAVLRPFSPILAATAAMPDTR